MSSFPPGGSCAGWSRGGPAQPAGGRAGAGRFDHATGGAGVGAAGLLRGDGGAGRRVQARQDICAGLCCVLFQGICGAGVAGAGCGGGRSTAWVRRCCGPDWSARTNCMPRDGAQPRAGSGRLSRAGSGGRGEQLAVPAGREDGRAAGAEAAAAKRRSRTGCGTRDGRATPPAIRWGFWMRSRSGSRPRHCCARCFRTICFRRR